ncbi:MAG TPA: HisA/HisF-related TIM barrel protein [Sphingobacteriaceae bacterium]|nr:HisA/HisF-related TIM barrel protein [Sphingobacteriaceae bacterium]
MEVIPAIDLRQGGAVRLLQGDPDQTFQYGDPVAAARRWQAEGARRLHVVDLDGAFAGRPVHLDTAREIAQATGLPIQYGGGLRDLEAAEEALQVVQWVIIGTLAVKNPEAVAPLAARYPGRVMAAVDLKDGRPASHGWQETTEDDPAQLARRLQDAGVACLLVTDTSRDGTMAGAAEETARRCAAWEVPFLWAGGITSVDDVHRLRRAGGKWLQGIVVGRALYEEKVRLPDLVAAAAGGDDGP